MKNKAVSEIVASLVMILIAASVGATLYIYSLSLFSDVKSNADLRVSLAKERQLEKFSVTYIYYDSDSETLYVYVYSYGTIEVNVSNIYVDDQNYAVSKLLYPSEIGNISVYPIELASGTHFLTVVSERGVKYESYFRTS